MEQEESPLIQPEELLQLMLREKIILVDARSGPAAKDKYVADHIDGALYVDLEKEMASVPNDPSNGGRHPLPEPEQFAKTLTGLGITPDSHVVVYDDKSGANAAARFWWMLKAMGHSKIQALNGGLDAAIKAGIPLSTKEESAFVTDPYPSKAWSMPLAAIEEVEEASHDDDFLVIDVREQERYLGEREPIDLVAGHIPGAINVPFSSNLDADGFYFPPSQLRDRYREMLGDRNPDKVIIHCGSGITACHTVLAMAYAGIQIPKLYVGSWSEWSRNELPVATGNRK